MPDGSTIRSAVRLDAIVERYIALRDRKAEMKKQYEDQVAAVDGAMDKIEAYLLKTMTDQGVESVKTPFGTPYKTTKIGTPVQDWDEFRRYVIETGDWSILTRSVSKAAVKAYREEHGDLPPGVGWTEIVAVNIRR
jgi:hypothetical protein